jgi:hypothetical protein
MTWQLFLTIIVASFLGAGAAGALWGRRPDAWYPGFSLFLGFVVYSLAMILIPQWIK